MSVTRRFYQSNFPSTFASRNTLGCTLKEDQPVGLLLNLFFSHFGHSEPTYKSRRIKASRCN